MKLWLTSIFLIALFLGVVAYRKYAATPALPPLSILPGNEADISLARGAVIVGYDAVDPVKTLEVTANNAPVAPDATLTTPEKFMQFMPLTPGEKYHIKLTTAHRSVEKDLTLRADVKAAEITRFEVPAPATADRDQVTTPLTFSPDGNYLAALLPGGELRMIAPLSNKLLWRKTVPPSAPYIFSADSKTVFGGGSAFDTESGEQSSNKESLPLQPPAELRADDAKRILQLEGAQLLLRSQDGKWFVLGIKGSGGAMEIKIFDLRNPEPRLAGTISAAHKKVHGAGISPDGRLIAVYSAPEADKDSATGTIQIFH